MATKKFEFSKDVYLFGTCIVDVGFSDAGIDAIKVLESFGIRVHFPMAQSCCGQPAFTSGNPKEATKVARAQLDLFPESWPIVVLSGSCTGMFRHHYSDLFKADDPDFERAKSVSDQAVEFTEYLACLPPLKSQNETPVSVVVHTACSAQRETDTQSSTQKILQYWPHVEQKIADHGTECCGFGGSFSVRFPNISGKMVDDKCQALEATKAEELISSDCACMMNINGRLAKRDAKLKGQHIASFIRAQCLPETSHE